MKLATAEQVLQSKGIVPNPGSLANAAQALEQSYPVLEGILETSFTAGYVTDYFTVYSDNTNNKYRLTNSFADVSTLVVRVSTDGLPLLNRTAGELVGTTAYVFDERRGVIELLGNPPYGTFSVSVTYNHGLPVDFSDETLLTAPQWLQQAAISLADAYLTSTQAGSAGRKDKVGNQAAVASFGAAKLSIDAYLRPRMTVHYPARTVNNG